MRAALVISPHLDDAILSAGQFLVGRPHVTVATVFAGTPPTTDVLTSYDRSCGFNRPWRLCRHVGPKTSKP
jgi:hypothetical protein